MSNTDSFIEEVTEEVRQEQLWTMVRRYGWIAGVAVIAIVGGATWNEIRKSQMETAAQAAGDGIILALETEDPQTRIQALSEARAAATSESGAANVLGFYEAAEAADAGDTARAATLYAEVAADSSLAQVYRDLAVLKGASLAGIDAVEARTSLESIAAPGAAFRLLAEEQLASLDLAAGETDAAIERLQNIAVDSEITSAQRVRVLQLLEALGGSLETT
ncbi:MULTISPECIES: hypothetical protein [Rhodobacterales]|uniref:Tetratricopeptide repeat-like domain-containing protein n=1 Tax=Halocynthiibacter styelae TaxID=2761955 RepID=A0A8J7IS08_9RHOB|nr:MULTISPECIES: hypothetical protein [Rhodobacterales]MBI1494466.1 hypothetical protein [Paenihalocynthiibacter styelae]